MPSLCFPSCEERILPHTVTHYWHESNAPSHLQYLTARRMASAQELPSPSIIITAPLRQFLEKSFIFISLMFLYKIHSFVFIWHQYCAFSQSISYLVCWDPDARSPLWGSTWLVPLKTSKRSFYSSMSSNAWPCNPVCSVISCYVPCRVLLTGFGIHPYVYTMVIHVRACGLSPAELTKGHAHTHTRLQTRKQLTGHGRTGSEEEQNRDKGG